MQINRIAKAVFGPGIEVFSNRKSGIPEVSETPKETLIPKNLKDMTRSERIYAANQVILASLQYKKQFTEIFLNEIGDRNGMHDFNINIKMGIMNTMPERAHEVFLRRISRIASFAESLGYEVIFNKWRKEKEYSWFFKKEI